MLCTMMLVTTYSIFERKKNFFASGSLHYEFVIHLMIYDWFSLNNFIYSIFGKWQYVDTSYEWYMKIELEIAERNVL